MPPRRTRDSPDTESWVEKSIEDGFDSEDAGAEEIQEYFGEPDVRNLEEIADLHLRKEFLQ